MKTRASRQLRATISSIEKAAPAKKPPFLTKRQQTSIEKARLHLIGVCLLDSVYAWHIPACIHLSEYGAMTVLLLQRGMSLDAIIRHLEAVGIADAHRMLLRALGSVPDGSDLGLMFWRAVGILTEYVQV